MSAVSDEEIRASVVQPDVHVCRSKSGLWTYFSELVDGRWIIEYEPRFSYERGGVAVVGPFGVRERLPIEAPIVNIGRVLLTTFESSAEMACEVAEVAALVSAHAVTLSEFEPSTSLPWPAMEGVLYEITTDGSSVPMIGYVERYSDEDLFRLDTGESFPLEEVRSMLWPEGATIYR